MTAPLSLLLVEDNDDDAELILRALRLGGYAPAARRVDSLSGVGAALDEGGWDVIVCDYGLPTCNGLDVLRTVRQRDWDTPFVFVSGTIGEDTAVKAMRAGAQDYILKGNLKRLEPAITRELRDAHDRREHRRVTAALADVEDRLGQAHKTELVARLAGGIAHDFNNLFAVVMLAADVARDDAPERVHPMLEDIMQAALQGSALTRQLLALGGQQALDPRMVDVNALIQGQETLLRRLAGEPVTLDLTLAPDVRRVKVDPAQFEQVMLNLCVNARDAMPDGGQLTIETQLVTLGRAVPTVNGPVPPGSYVTVAVSDTGTGMSPRTIEQIFEPFFTTKQTGRGTGLGLAVVHGILRQSRGHISVESALGFGTTFRIYLPVAVEAGGETDMPCADAALTPANRLHGNEVVLVAEDDATLRTVVTRALTGCGYTVLAAADATEAMALAAQYPDPIPLLLTDVVLPGLTGPQLAEALWRDRPDTRVVFMSGYMPEHVRREGAAIVEGHFLAKPFTMVDLARKVRDTLDG
jgi:two-component system cell cycle sensor histidine kinase/response regulator CckA